jgi:DNA-binding CsgD family transcriptional regulator
VLKPLRLGPVHVARTKFLPDSIAPLVDAAERGLDIAPAIEAITEGFGFDSFMYAIANYHLRPDNQERMYVYTTLPMDWVSRYDQQAYVECDPRVQRTFECALPLVWDRTSEMGRSARTDAFLEDAAAHGVGSGVAFSVYTGFPARTLVALNSRKRIISKAQRTDITLHLGEIVLLGQYFHEVFVKGVVEKGVAPISQGAPLSPRERQCLQLAANGMTSADIGNKLGITERTVHFHFSNLFSKLGVLNRLEAIATATARGIVRPGG